MRFSTPTGRLELATHVRACELDGQVILLDLKANRYIGVGRAASSHLAERVDGWPSKLARRPADAESAGRAGAAFRLGGSFEDGLTESLVSQGLLTTGRAGSRLLVGNAQPIEEPTASLDLGDLRTRPLGGPRRMASFMGSAMRAAWWLRTRSLQSIAWRVGLRRERRSGAWPGTLEQMMQGAAAYERLRPLLLTAHEKCLFDSLTLIGFLAAQELYPHWVIGVKTGPFGAHSWVQSGSTVLNDQHEHVRGFRPILVV